MTLALGVFLKRKQTSYVVRRGVGCIIIKFKMVIKKFLNYSLQQ